MSYEFTKLSEVPAVSEFPEGANAIIEANGEIKRCPHSNTPNPLTFTGAVTGSYDGSEALTVEIPSVPKPLTYDYMPEGYPSKSVQTTTLMEEQAVEFALNDSSYMAQITNAPEIVVGQTYIVKWDGTEYECVCFEFNSYPALGNLSIMGTGDDTGEPFIYAYKTSLHAGQLLTLDPSATHTISVKTTEEFLPTTAKNTTVFYL